MDRQTDRQADRQTDRPTDNQTDRQTNKQTDLNPTSGAIITTLPAAGSTIWTLAVILTLSTFFDEKIGLFLSIIEKKNKHKIKGKEEDDS